MPHDVFISHSAKDKTAADAVCAVLESEGIRCWIAPRDVVPGMEWGECIIEAIEQTRVMVLVFTADANASPQIRREVERAVNHGVAILPLRIENVMPGRALEYFIGNVHWLDALTPPLEAHLKRLAGTVKMLRDRMGTRDVSPVGLAAAEVPQAAKPPETTAVPPAEPNVAPSEAPRLAEMVHETTVDSPRSRRLPLLQLFAGKSREKQRFERVVLIAFAVFAVGLGFWGYAIVGSNYPADFQVGFPFARAHSLYTDNRTSLEVIRCLIASIGLIRVDELFQPDRDPWQLVIAQILVPGVALGSVVQQILSGIRRSIRR